MPRLPWPAFICYSRSWISELCEVNLIALNMNIIRISETWTIQPAISCFHYKEDSHWRAFVLRVTNCLWGERKGRRRDTQGWCLLLGTSKVKTNTLKAQAVAKTMATSLDSLTITLAVWTEGSGSWFTKNLRITLRMSSPCKPSPFSLFVIHGSCKNESLLCIAFERRM
jgi:hypothetical protein